MQFEFQHETQKLIKVVSGIFDKLRRASCHGINLTAKEIREMNGMGTGPHASSGFRWIPVIRYPRKP